MAETKSIDRDKCVAELTEALAEHAICMMLMRHPAGCYAYVNLWDDGDITSGLEASWCSPSPDYDGQWMRVVGTNTPHDTFGAYDMPFGVERDDESDSLFLIDKPIGEMHQIDVDGVDGYLCGMDKDRIADEGAKVLMGLAWDADDYCGIDPLVDQDAVEELVDAWIAGDREKAEKIAEQF